MTELRIKHDFLCDHLITYEDFISIFEQLIDEFIKKSEDQRFNAKLFNQNTKSHQLNKMIDLLLKENDINILSSKFLLIFFSSIITFNIDDFIANRYDLIINSDQFPFHMNIELENYSFYNLSENDDMIQIVIEDFEKNTKIFLDSLGITSSIDTFFSHFFLKLI
jgi:hypothetical protein